MDYPPEFLLPARKQTTPQGQNVAQLNAQAHKITEGLYKCTEP
jgi:hypothetical protein